MVFEDDFNAVDLTKWSVATGMIRNSEIQSYRPENVTCENGVLKLTAKKESFNGASYTSGEIDSKRQFLFGKFEAEIKVPKGVCFFPRFLAVWTN